jgi:hypothetical protein
VPVGAIDIQLLMLTGVNWNGLPLSFACNAAAPNITASTTTPSVAPGDVTPIRTNAIAMGAQANCNSTTAATAALLAATGLDSRAAGLLSIR